MMIVSAALAAKSSTETARKARSETRSEGIRVIPGLAVCP
jgi:hypothetical protein